jgi:hypothetical protein
MQLIHPDFLLRDTVTFSTPYNAGSQVDVEITAKQKTDPLPGPSGIYVSWEVSRGVAEVSPQIPGHGYVAKQQFVMIFEGRESGGAGTVWYACEASDVQTNNRYLMGTGTSARAAFENFCERARVVLSDSPEDKTKASDYGDTETIENMREQANRCFMKG